MAVVDAEVVEALERTWPKVDLLERAWVWPDRLADLRELQRQH